VNKPSKCEINVGIGVNLRTTDEYEKQSCFYSSIGYDNVMQHVPALKEKLAKYYVNSHCTDCVFAWDDANAKQALWTRVGIGSYELKMNPLEKASVYQVIGKL